MTNIINQYCWYCTKFFNRVGLHNNLFLKKLLVIDINIYKIVIIDYYTNVYTNIYTNVYKYGNKKNLIINIMSYPQKI